MKYLKNHTPPIKGILIDKKQNFILSFVFFLLSICPTLIYIPPSCRRPRWLADARVGKSSPIPSG
jgi:hypothetical protein